MTTVMQCILISFRPDNRSMKKSLNLVKEIKEAGLVVSLVRSSQTFQKPMDHDAL